MEATSLLLSSGYTLSGFFKLHPSYFYSKDMTRTVRLPADIDMSGETGSLAIAKYMDMYRRTHYAEGLRKPEAILVTAQQFDQIVYSSDVKRLYGKDVKQPIWKVSFAKIPIMIK